jgi:flagellar motor component MotA
MWEKFLLSTAMKILDHLSKKGLIAIKKEQTRSSIKDEVRSILSGNTPPENISEILAHGGNELGPFDEDLRSLRRISVTYKKAAAKKPAAKKMARKPAAKKIIRK